MNQRSYLTKLIKKSTNETAQFSWAEKLNKNKKRRKPCWIQEKMKYEF